LSLLVYTTYIILYLRCLLICKYKFNNGTILEILNNKTIKQIYASSMLIKLKKELGKTSQAQCRVQICIYV